MTFPQPNSVAPVLGGQQSFRLKTPLSSAGDIYESEVSSLGFVLGPDSDIANVLLSYYNGATNQVTQALVTPDRSLIGRIDARNEVQYPGPGSRRGRILISVDDIFDPRWRPDGFNAGDGDVIEFEVPVLDVIQYFINPPSLIPPRSDRLFRYQYFRAPGGSPPQSSWIILPAFGRKSGYFSFKNLDNSDTITANVIGVKMSTSADPGPVGAYQVQLNTVAIIFGSSAEFVYKSSTHGLWDLMAIQLLNYNGEAMPTTVILSDDAL